MSIVKLQNVRLAFPDLFEAKAFEAGQVPKFGATLLIPKDSKQAAEVEKAIQAVAKEKWGAKADAILKSLRGNPQKFCFNDGDLKPDYDGYEGNMSLSAKNKSRPTVLDRDKSPLTEADGKPYAGCFVNGSVEIWAQDNAFGKGIRATLRGVQFNRDGDAFSGGRPADPDEFDDLGDGADADDLT